MTAVAVAADEAKRTSVLLTPLLLTNIQLPITWSDFQSLFNHLQRNDHFNNNHPHSLDEIYVLYRAAKQGHATAITRIASLYYQLHLLYGHHAHVHVSASSSFPPSHDVGVKVAQCYRLGALHNISRDAIYLYATCSKEGIGTEDDEPNYNEALKWLSQLVFTVGDASPEAIGKAYLKGRGVRCDEVKAFELFQKAAATGSLDGLYHVGRCHYTGRGTPIDSNKARQSWLRTCFSMPGSLVNNNYPSHALSALQLASIAHQGRTTGTSIDRVRLMDYVCDSGVTIRRPLPCQHPSCTCTFPHLRPFDVALSASAESYWSNVIETAENDASSGYFTIYIC
jgi:TPR repeat protein